MSDFEDEHADPPRLGGRLLGSARNDAPSAGARARVAGTLGIGVGAAAVVSGKAAAAATSAGGAAVMTSTTKAAGLGLWVKVVGAAAVTLAVGGGVVVATADPIVTSASASATPAASLPSTTTPDSARARRDEIPAPEPLAPPIATLEDPGEVTAIPRASATASSVRAGANANANANDEPSPLAREVRAIDLARSALVAGQPRAALMALDQHDRDFPNGPMRTEADVLRVDALDAAGDQAAAKRLASQLLARDPSGAHARHLRTIAGDK